jgi:flavodoxin
MEVLIIFDSNFGNTKKIADYMAGQIGRAASSISINNFKESDLLGIKLLIVGSPINAWRPTKKITEFLKRLDPAKLKGIKGAAFDTRVKSFISGNAAKKIAGALVNSGVNVIVEPIGFYVAGNEGPLMEGELKRAEDWIELIKSKL